MKVGDKCSEVQGCNPLSEDTKNVIKIGQAGACSWQVPITFAGKVGLRDAAADNRVKTAKANAGTVSIGKPE